MGRHFYSVRVPDPDARKVDKATIRRVVGTFRPYRGKVTIVGLAIITTATLGVINPLLIKVIFDQSLFGSPPGNCAGNPCPHLPTLYVYVGLMILIPVVSGIIGIGQTYLANVVGLRVMQDLRNALYR